MNPPDPTPTTAAQPPFHKVGAAPVSPVPPIPPILPSLEGFSYAEILDSLPDGAYLTDNQRRILFWNKAAEEITGWPREEVVGRCCRDNILVHKDKDGQQLCGFEACPLNRAIVTGTPSHEPMLVFAQCKSGNYIPVEVSVAPIRNHQGEVMGGIEIFRDMAQTFTDLDRARVIQQEILTLEIPRDPRVEIAYCYAPNGLVGGDFYRIEQVDADRYAIMVADVMGHGVAAALYMMQLRSLWEDYRKLLGQPGQFMSVLNRRLHAMTHQNHYFATAVHLVVNVATGAIQYVRAGHEMPLLFRANREVTRLGQGGACLGMFPETSYEPGEAQIGPGEALILYTDGAEEVCNAVGTELGLEGFVRLVQASAPQGKPPNLDKIREALLKYSNAIRLPDDLTLISLWRAL